MAHLVQVFDAGLSGCLYVPQDWYNHRRYRTMYYHTLGKLLFMDIRDNKEVPWKLRKLWKLLRVQSDIIAQKPRSISP